MVPRPDPYDRRVTMAIDVGNSAVKAAHVTRDVVGDVRRWPTRPAPDPAVIELLLGSTADPVALVSVVPAWTAAIAAAAGRSDRALVQATHDTIPIPVRARSASTVGADRLLGAWVARELVGAPCIVVDVGTATTIDVVDAAGAFVGGAILPGPALALRSLAHGTALLPEVPLTLPDRAIGRDTREAIASGVVLGHHEAVGALVARMAIELARRPTVVLTGGDATALGAPDWADRAEPDLLLRGLGALAERLLAETSVGPRA